MQTSDFERLYRIVSDRLLSAPVVRSSKYEDWVLSLIVTFWTEYRQWPGDAHCSDYLARLEDRRVPREVRVACHALLHIGYDLPRCLALSFRQPDLLLTSNDPQFLQLTDAGARWFNERERSTINRRSLVDSIGAKPAISVVLALSIFARRSDKPSNAQREVYLQLQSVFYNLMHDREVLRLFADMSIITKFSVFAGMLVGRRAMQDSLQVLCHWMIALRTTAWVHGEMIHNSNLPCSQICGTLFECVDQVQRQTVLRCEELNRGQWNPLFVFSKLAGLAQLSPPQFVLAALPLPILAAIVIPNTPWLWATLSAMLAAGYWVAATIARKLAIMEILESLAIEADAGLKFFRLQISGSSESKSES